MSGKLTHFEVPAKDGARARKFYTTLLGWKLKDAGVPGLDYFMTEGVDPTGAVFTSPEGNGLVIYFEVDDIDASIKKAKEIGGTADAKQPVPGQGWFSRCTDTEGNKFSLYRPDLKAGLPS